MSYSSIEELSSVPQNLGNAAAVACTDVIGRNEDRIGTYTDVIDGNDGNVEVYLAEVVVFVRR